MALTGPIPGAVCSRRVSGLLAGLVAQAALDHGDPLVAGLQLVEMQAGKFDNERWKIVVGIVDLPDQRLHEGQTGRCDDAVFHEMSPQGVDDLVALPNQEIARFEDHGPGLLLARLYGHEPHGGSSRRLDDGLGIVRVVLLPLHERFT
jgi:hypothetical protein